ncbi:hypothetical protein P8C59_004608 [Phyllachora maydis]|uniref:Uncharacterized protein n=1 Tax=Phyllachora maydis TaxID=1825666 RepID=A0AAD9I331_9PEZI|nr:hypothetical protein P8C59_004608 [Phyllachora maydis]
MANPDTPPPVKVSSSAASYTQATLDPDLRSKINTLLLTEGHVTKIQDHLLHALHAHPTNWPTAVQSHALSLLRSGEASTFPTLLRRVMDDVRQATTERRDAAATGSGSSANGVRNGADATNGTAPAAAAGTTPGALALPLPVEEELLKVTRECLDQVCELTDGGP